MLLSEAVFEQGHEREAPPLKRRYFTANSLSSVKTVTDRHSQALVSFGGINIDDLELPK